MNITNLELTNFRNYKKFKLENLEQINIIIGNNGVGKTTILESIYVLCLARSFKSNLEINLINEKSDYLKIKGTVKNDIKIKKLEYLLTKNGKKTKINGTLKKKISDFISQYKVILYAPDEIKFIKDSPSNRRSYINISLSQINKSYIKLLNNYNVLIKNKNDYYKKLYVNSFIDQSYLDVLDEKIAEIGYEIYKIRCSYTENINKYLKKIVKKLKLNSDLHLNYVSQYLGFNEKKFVELLRKNRKKELPYGITKTGIHRDDFEFLIKDKNVKDYCSQGNQKMIMLAFKLAELEVLIKEYYEEPILLLDDLFSELDCFNQNMILNSLNKNIQIFITTTDVNNIKKDILKNAKIIDLDRMVKI